MTAKTETQSPAPAAKKQRGSTKPKKENPQTPNGKGKKAPTTAAEFNISTEFEDGDGNVLKAEEADDDDYLV